MAGSGVNDTVHDIPPPLVGLLAALASAALIASLRVLAPVLGLIDRPGGRKTHHAPMPVIGGLAMYIALMPALLWIPHRHQGALTAALGLLVMVGMVDDKTQVSARARLAFELGAAAIIIACDGSVRHLGDLLGFGPIGTSLAAPLFTALCFVGAANAFNMADGLDGLAGTLAFVACSWFTAIALLEGNLPMAAVGAAVLGVLSGFLAFNLRTPWRGRAAVFMGDAGSTTIGFLLAWFAIELAGQRSSLLTPIGAVWIIALPLIDGGTVMLYRLRHHASPFRADRLHIHYRLVDGGMEVSRAVSVLAMGGVACGAIGVGFPLLGIPEWMMLAGFFAAWMLSYRWLERTQNAAVVQPETREVVLAARPPIYPPSSATPS